MRQQLLAIEVTIPALAARATEKVNSINTLASSRIRTRTKRRCRFHFKYTVTSNFWRRPVRKDRLLALFGLNAIVYRHLGLRFTVCFYCGHYFVILNHLEMNIVIWSHFGPSHGESIITIVARSCTECSRCVRVRACILLLRLGARESALIASGEEGVRWICFPGWRSSRTTL